MFVLKPRGKKQLVVDFRKLNNIIEKDRYTLLLIQDLQDQIARAVFFTKINLRDGFYNIQIKQGNKQKTAFRTYLGLYKFCVMPIGLTNVLATFQRHVNYVLYKYLYKFALAYLDDILVYSRTMDEHIDYVQKVLQKLRDFNLQAKLEKCKFYVKEVKFLEYVLLGTEIRIDLEKVEAVKNQPTLTNKTEVQSFIGFLNYYQKFIKKYKDIARLLTNLTKDNVVFEQTLEVETAFQDLKKRYISKPILIYFNIEKALIVETDVSNRAIRAQLRQLDKNRVLRLVAYFSRQLYRVELNYDVYNKELLAIVEMFQTQRHYLLGAKFLVKVITNYKNLTYFITTKVLIGQHIRQQEKLIEFDFTISYQKGLDNVRADALSRQKTFNKKKKVKSQAFFKEKDRAVVLNKIEIALTVIKQQDDVQETKIKAVYNRDCIAKQILNKTLDDFVINATRIIRFKDLIYILANVSREFVLDQYTKPTFRHSRITKLQELLLETFYFPYMLKRIKEQISKCY